MQTSNRLFAPLPALVALLLFVAAPGVQADAEEVHQLGIQVSGISGSGLNYQLQFERWAFETTAFFLHQNFEKNDRLEYSLGVEAQYTVQHRDGMRTYFVVGFSRRISEYTSIDPIPGFDGAIQRETEDYGFGPGMGIEVLLFEHLAMSLDLGYAFSSKDDGQFGETRIAGALGVGYRF